MGDNRHTGGERTAADKVMEAGKHGESVKCLPDMTNKENSDLAKQLSTERRSNPGFLPDLQISWDSDGAHVKAKGGTCGDNTAQSKADEIQKGPQDSKTVIGKINGITNEADKQRVLEEVKHRPNDFPNVKVVNEQGREPNPGDKLKAVPFDQKQVQETWKSVGDELQKAGVKRAADEAARLQHMREHPEETAHKLEELAKQGKGLAGDQKAESEYRHGMDDLNKLPADIKQKVIAAMVADPTVETTVRGSEVIQNANDNTKRDVVDMDKSYAQQAEEAKQQFVNNSESMIEKGMPSRQAAETFLNSEAQKQGTAGAVSTDRVLWFNHK